MYRAPRPVAHMNEKIDMHYSVTHNSWMAKQLITRWYTRKQGNGSVYKQQKVITCSCLSLLSKKLANICRNVIVYMYIVMTFLFKLFIRHNTIVQKSWLSKHIYSEPNVTQFIEKNNMTGKIWYGEPPLVCLSHNKGHSLTSIGLYSGKTTPC